MEKFITIIVNGLTVIVGSDGKFIDNGSFIDIEKRGVWMGYFMYGELKFISDNKLDGVHYITYTII